MNTWQVGDRAIVNYPISSAHGKIVTVTSGLVVVNCPTNGVYMGHQIDHPNVTIPGEYIFLEPHELIPIPDGYDGLTISSWDECPFKPRELVQ